MKKSIVPSIAILLATLALCIATSVVTIRSRRAAYAAEEEARRAEQLLQAVTETQELFAAERFIVHAGGRIEGADGETYKRTNSKEALKHYAEEGTSALLEIDFLMTTDGELVLGHAWKEFGKDGVPFEGAVSKETFLSGQTMESNLTPASLEDLVYVMQERPDTVVITDAKKDNVGCMQKLAAAYPELRSRFVVQIYHAEEYDPIYEAGFLRILYTLYKAKAEEVDPAVLQTVLAEKKLVGLTFPVGWMNEEKKPGWFSAMQEAEIPLFVHTVNKKKTMTKCFAQGIDAIYTDLVDTAAYKELA